MIQWFVLTCDLTKLKQLFKKKKYQDIFIFRKKKCLKPVCGCLACHSLFALSEISLHVHNGDLYLYWESAVAYISQSQARVYPLLCPDLVMIRSMFCKQQCEKSALDLHCLMTLLGLIIVCSCRAPGWDDIHQWIFWPTHF